ncbi:MAG: trigger factor [Solirubrobacterales bacterium]|nr:trigger factor [Solirubrobacterales bacterium]
MKTTVNELPDSRIRVEAEVEAPDVEVRMRQTAEALSKEMKIPGFRQGKVPPEMVIQRLGRESVLKQTLESSLADWYEGALLDAAVEPVGSPELNVADFPDEGGPLRFTIEVGVRPKAELGEYRGLDVGRESTEVPADAVDAELERLREGFASLNTVERAASEGDVVLIDYRGEVDGEPFEGGEARDYLLELGAGRVLEDFEKALEGASAGDERKASVTFPDDYQAEEMAGKTAEFTISAKEVREKELPELDDDFASEASEFDTLEELRGQIESQLAEVLDRQAVERFREAALDAAADNSTVELPEPIVAARAEEGWERLERQIREQGMEPEAYLQMQGKTREEAIAEAKPGAEKALRREATLAAVAEAEEIEVTEDEMLEALQIPPGHEDHGHPEPADALAELRRSGREGLLQQDLRMRRAMELIAEEANPIPLKQAEAREKIWTPEKEKEREAEESAGLWTPGSD